MFGPRRLKFLGAIHGEHTAQGACEPNGCGQMWVKHDDDVMRHASLCYAAVR